MATNTLSNKSTKKPNIDFFEALRMKYEPEAFTGYIGVLLDEHAEPSDKEDSMRFLEQLYKLAAKYV